MPNDSLPPETHIGSLHLTVLNLARSLLFYKDTLGFKLLEPGDGTAAPGGHDTAALGDAGDRPLLFLTARPDARPRPARSAGLYHFAILLPSRADLARSLQRLAEKRYPLQGASDHGVSEALYLADPDGNGIEIYADRPPQQWPRNNGELQMVTERLNVEDLMRTLPRGEHLSEGLPPGTRIGHIHLQVGDLGRAQAFYQDVLGLDLVQRYGPSAAFLSAGGYHHHVGLNTWAGVGVPPAPPGASGLVSYTIVLPDVAELERAAGRLAAAGIEYERRDGELMTRDPAGNGIVLAAAWQPVGGARS